MNEPYRYHTKDEKKKKFPSRSGRGGTCTLKINRVINRAIHKHEIKQCTNAYAPDDYQIAVASTVHFRERINAVRAIFAHFINLAALVCPPIS